MNEQVVLLGSAIGTTFDVDGRILKQILPRNKTYRWPNQPGKMLHITDEVLAQVVKNFKSGVVDVVPFFKVNDKNAHTEDPEAARGKIVDLNLGEDGLYAVIEANSPEAHKQILASGLGASAGLNLAYETHDTGTNVGAVLRHVAWTPEPWIPGMRPFEQVSLSDETFEAVYLSTDDGDQMGDGGDTMDPKEIKQMIDAAVKDATADLSASLDEAKTANESLATQVTALTTALNQRAHNDTAESVDAELSAMIAAGLPPAIADLARPVMLAGSTEVNLSSGDTSTVATQMRAMLALVPKIDFSEIGESGVPEGHVVLSAEQVKNLGFKVEKKEDDEDDDNAELSAEQKADAEAIANVTKFIKQPE